MKNTHHSASSSHAFGLNLSVNSPRLWQCCWRCCGQQMEAALWEAVLCWAWLKLHHQPWSQESEQSQNKESETTLFRKVHEQSSDVSTASQSFVINNKIINFILFRAGFSRIWIKLLEKKLGYTNNPAQRTVLEQCPRTQHREQL